MGVRVIHPTVPFLSKGLRFRNFANCRVTHSNPIGISSPTVFTVYAWVRATGTTGRLFSKTEPTTNLGFMQGLLFSTNAFLVNVDYSGANDASSQTVDNAVVQNVPFFVATTFDGTTAPKIFFKYPWQAVVTEASYASQTAPEGSRVSDSGGPFIVGSRNASVGDNPWIGDIYLFHLIVGATLGVEQLTRHAIEPQLHWGTRIFCAYNTGHVLARDLGPWQNHGFIEGSMAVVSGPPALTTHRKSYKAAQTAGPLVNGPILKSLLGNSLVRSA